MQPHSLQIVSSRLVEKEKEKADRRVQLACSLHRLCTAEGMRCGYKNIRSMDTKCRVQLCFPWCYRVETQLPAPPTHSRLVVTDS